MANKSIIVTKVSGKQDVFDVAKLRNSLERSGANDKVIQQIVDEISAILYNGITTKEIYNKAFSLLRKTSKSTAARYKLKKAIMELGPTGYPFEKFVGEILKYQGFNVEVGKIVEGHCVNHEVDVVAEKDTKQYMVECKFHGDQSRNCDVKVSLYIHSRFIDIEKKWKEKSMDEVKFHQGWIFTNTKFSSDAIKYGNCVGLMLVGWDYPKVGSLKERIDLSGLHPVTCLTTLTKYEKRRLIAKQKVLCKDICLQPEVLSAINVSNTRQQNVLKEASELCNIKAK